MGDAKNKAMRARRTAARLVIAILNEDMDGALEVVNHLPASDGVSTLVAMHNFLCEAYPDRAVLHSKMAQVLAEPVEWQ